MKKLILLFSILSIANSNSIGYVDIKGNVNNPGVYKIYENETIQDVINKSGGFKKNSFTDNINLSKLVKDEMVIYIYSKKEIDKINELNNCDCSPVIKYIECSEDKKIIKEDNEIETTSKITTEITNPTINDITTSITTTKTRDNTTTSKQVTTKVHTTSPTTTTITSNINKKININTCTLEELISLKGLGESKAKSIIEYRNNNGLFNSIEEILNVSGIGNKIFENIKDFIEV